MTPRLAWRWVGVAAIAVACSSRVQLGSTGERGGEGPGVGDSERAATGGAPGHAGSPGAGQEATGGSASEDARPCCGASVTDEGTDGAGEACAADDYAMDPSPLDVLVMMDRSDSMNEPLADDTMTRWEGIRNAVFEFVTDPEVMQRKIRIGIQFFAQTDGNYPEIDCDVDSYATPAVPIGDVADVGDAILAEIDARTRAGPTPTLPALQGALKYAKAWAKSHADEHRPTVVVLVTDGMPTVCQDPVSVPEIAGAAAKALQEEPAIRTFVVGIGPGVSNLDQIAQQGGTGQAFLLDSGSTAAQLVDALKKITLNITCQFEIPPAPGDGQVINYKKIRVFYRPDPDSAEQCAAIQEVPWVDGHEGCVGATNGGWYFDDESEPGTLRVCPCTCALFGVGHVNIQYGCSPLGR